MRKQLYYFLAISIFSCFSCQSDATVNKKSTIAKETTTGDTTTNKTITSAGNAEYYTISKPLQAEERRFFAVLKKENQDLLFSDEVKRFYAAKDSSLIFSEIVVPKDTLLSGGYVFYSFAYFGEISKESDVRITYSYSLGQMDSKTGSVYGPNVNDYFHTYTGYGLSAKVVVMYNNGKQLYTKTIPLKNN